MKRNLEAPSREGRGEILGETMKHDSLLGRRAARSHAHRKEEAKEREKEVSGVTFHLREVGRSGGRATVLSNAHERERRRENSVSEL